MTTATAAFVAGIDIGSATCVLRVLRPDKSPVGKAWEFPNSAPGFASLHTRLGALGVPPTDIGVGLEATGPYWEHLHALLQEAGYAVVVLAPQQTHEFAKQRGLRAKTDRLDAETIARLLLSGEARACYVPNEQIASYRSLVRLRESLQEEVTRTHLELRSRLVELFPEFTTVFADPSRPSALAVLQRYPSPQAIQEAGVDAVLECLRAVVPRRYGRGTAVKLVAVAAGSMSSGRAAAARAVGVRILADQLAHTQANLAAVEAEIAALVSRDDGAGGLRSVPEFGDKTAALLRAELGEVERFGSSEQVVAYVGLDVQVRQSGKWQGQRKLSKRGSGRVRRALYMAALASIRRAESAFGDYYQHLVGKGVRKGSALMAVMRKMVGVAYRLLRSGGVYDPTKVWAGAQPLPGASREAPAAA